MKTKKVFIDFGSGPSVKWLIYYKKLGYYTVSVNKLFRDLKSKDIEYLKLITDEMFFFDFSDLSNKCGNHKADNWICGAVLEHVEPEKIDGFLQNMINHSKDNFIGEISIDLSDHKGGFRHYENFENDEWLFIKNILKKDEWYEKIHKYFDISSYREGFKFKDKQNRPTTLFFTVSKK